MDEKKIQELLKKYHEGICTPEEKKVLDSWYETLFIGTKPFSDPWQADEARNRSWALVQSRIERDHVKHIPVRNKVLRINWYLTGVAASIALLVSLFFLLRKESSFEGVGGEPAGHIAQQQDINNDTSEPINVSLSDGTEITLLPESRVTFNEVFSGSERQVFLEGEAFFNVAHDANRPFFVVTSKLTTKVLGTSFLVRAYSEEKAAIVSVRTGKVSVQTHAQNSDSSPNSPEEIILTPNQEVIFNSDEHRVMKKLVDKPEVILPKPTLQYDHLNTRVTDIIESLELNYGIDIQYDSALLSNCTITSDMSGAGFLEHIKIICNALGAEYKISETTVTIKGGSACNAR